jgi:hypothetical protein
MSHEGLDAGKWLGGGESIGRNRTNVKLGGPKGRSLDDDDVTYSVTKSDELVEASRENISGGDSGVLRRRAGGKTIIAIGGP